MVDPTSLSAVAIADRMREGRLSAVSVAEAYLARIDAREPVIRAFAHFDPLAVLKEAEIADGRPLPPLHGLPLGVKDVLDTADMPTAYGSPIWSGYRPKGDAAAVALARRAGAIVMGKTVTAEFAARHPGPTRNPVNPEHTPGGSSSGSAAGVAAGFFPFALATQTAGSIIRPAAFCGVVGFKPTKGTIHRAGMRVMSETLDTIGAIARTVADCALLVGAVGSRDLGNPDRRPERRPRFGLCMGHAPERAEASTVELIENVARAAEKAGATIAPFDLPEPIAAAASIHRTIMYAEGAQGLSWELNTAPELLSEALREHLEWGRAQPRESLEKAYRILRDARRFFAEATRDFDAVLTPSAPGEAPEGLASTGDSVFNLLWTALAVPCVTVPAGHGPKGLPLGIQIVARRSEDRAALAWAEWIRNAIG